MQQILIKMSYKYKIRKAKLEECPVILPLYDEGRKIMRSDNNMEQWNDGYPNEKSLRQDILNENCYVMEEPDGNIAATFALIESSDPTYKNIYEGAWKDDTLPYGTIHRLSSKADKHGIAECCFDWCFKKCPNLRIDTHKDNHIMQHVIKKAGFEYCGIIHLLDGNERLAYQKVDTSNIISLSLKQYINRNIIPQYDNFDKGHQREHVEMVIRESLRLSLKYHYNTNIAYVIAAYHDTGLCLGREYHHLESGRIIRKDKILRNWFNAEEIEMMVQAAEDHRASSKNEPRSIYGKIVAEADRWIDGDDIIKRTIQYGWSHYPELSEEEQIERTKKHLSEKYAENGYLKLWFEDSENSIRLKKFRIQLKDAEWVNEKIRLIIKRNK